jgi:uncharacterized membrane protein
MTITGILLLIAGLVALVASGSAASQVLSMILVLIGVLVLLASALHKAIAAHTERIVRALEKNERSQP